MKSRELLFACFPSDLIFLSAFLQDFDEMDLEMLAPYISMDDDFQLTFLSSLTEEANKPLSSSSELLAVAPVCRKRYDGPHPSLRRRLNLDRKFVLRVAPEDRLCWRSQKGVVLCEVVLRDKL